MSSVYVPVSGIDPDTMLLCTISLTSGNMCVRHVAKMTPPPKQLRHEMNVSHRDRLLLFSELNPPVSWPPMQRLKRRGNSPRIREMPPKSTMEMIFTVNTSIFKLLLLML